MHAGQVQTLQMAVAPPPASRLTNIKEPFRPLQSLNVKGVSELHESSMNDALICWLSPLKCSAHTHTHAYKNTHIHSHTYLKAQDLVVLMVQLLRSLSLANHTLRCLSAHIHTNTHTQIKPFMLSLLFCVRAMCAQKYATKELSGWRKKHKLHYKHNGMHTFATTTTTSSNKQ